MWLNLENVQDWRICVCVSVCLSQTVCGSGRACLQEK